MTNIFKKPSFNKPWTVLFIGGLLLGSVGMNRVDDFFNTHTVSYRSPVLLQAPMVATPKVAQTVVVRVYATPSASPETNTVAPTETATPEPAIKKVQLLR